MKIRDTLDLLLLSAIWGSGFLLISIALQSFPPIWVALVRVIIGSAFLWAVLLIKRCSLPPLRLLGWLLLAALFNNAIPFVFFAIGERTVPSSTAAVINATSPIWALLLSLSFMRQKSESRTILGVALGFFGVILIVYSHGANSAAVSSIQSYAIGVLFIALASAGYAASTVLAKAKLADLDPIGLATTQLSLASFMILPVALLGPRPIHIQTSSILASITLGIVGSGVAYLLYYSLLNRISSTRVVSVNYLLPIWGLFWGLIAHEHIAALAYEGVAIVILGLYLLNRKSPAEQSLPQSSADSVHPSSPANRLCGSVSQA